MQLKEGSQLQGGKYRIIRVLGQGGFGITYLAENILLGRMVALKEFFPKDFCGRDNTSHLTLGTQNNAETVAKLKARFLKEARNIARLDHPGIVKIHDVFEENNTAYYAMDYIDGENLSQIVKRNGPLSEAKAIEYIRKVGDALDYIHSRNMTHFDVKPANIMVRRSDDQPILIDFGLSKQYDRQGEATSTLMQAVSHGYSPIELYNAAGIQTFSPQTDVYSLGATLYFLVTGSVPPSANELIENELTLPATVSTNLRDVIKGSMQVSRAKRPNSVYGFLNDIETPPSYKKSVQTDEDTILVEPEPVKTSTNTNQVPPTYNQVPYNHLPNLEKRSNPFINVWTILFGCLIIGFFILVVNLSTSDTNYKVNTPTVNVAAAKPASPTSVTITNYQSSLGPCTYTGEVDSEGRPHGYGKAQWDAGVGNAYFGNWVHGSMDGECTYISRGGYTFTGKFKAGHYHSGTLVSPDGSYYKGDFDSNGNKWTGTEYDSNGNITDTWKNGK